MNFDKIKQKYGLDKADFATKVTKIPSFVQISCQKKIKWLIFSHLTFAFVGITGLEPATSRPPDVCATNCAKSRFCSAKVNTLNEKSKLLGEIFLNYGKNSRVDSFYYQYCQGNLVNLVNDK